MNKKVITIPVLKSFGSNDPIGIISINTDELPPDPNFVFTIAFEHKATGAPGTIPTESPRGPYKLVAAAIYSDAAYAEYLQQIGVVAAAKSIAADSVCNWHQHDECSDGFSTGCGHEYIINDADPSGMNFCVYCGKPAEFHKWKPDDDTTEAEL